ncbi:ubiquitin-associated domain-containing protein 2 isoform X2 [Ambystoma mexicanum]|uniref:ubiquitin-associated domain-containing protein 2 isoform X2 n=1 Tax=Ambystoma mexicanum TaxID=8296 RepID=UPI0037E938E6
MLTSTGSSGLYKAPVSKGLLLVPSALSVLLVLLFHHYLSFFQYNVQEVKEDFQIWRIVLGRIICLDLKDTLCSSMLIYNFRIFERRYGSRKFTSFLLGTWILSALLECVLVEALRHAFGVAVNRLPSGFLAPIFALFVPFYCSIPGVQVTVVFGHFPVSNKTLVYIVGLQLLTSSPSMSIIASSGLIAGLFYSSNVWEVTKVLYIPGWVAKIFSSTLEPLFSSAIPATESREGMGATLDIQRQQRMELLDQQILLSQFAARGQPRQPQVGMLNWSRLFTPLRHGLFPNVAANQHPAQEVRHPATEEQDCPNMSQCQHIVSSELDCSTYGDGIFQG